MVRPPCARTMLPAKCTSTGGSRPLWPNPTPSLWPMNVLLTIFARNTCACEKPGPRGVPPPMISGASRVST